jgi:hypothetical protein
MTTNKSLQFPATTALTLLIAPLKDGEFAIGQRLTGIPEVPLRFGRKPTRSGVGGCSISRSQAGGSGYRCEALLQIVGVHDRRELHFSVELPEKRLGEWRDGRGVGHVENEEGRAPPMKQSPPNIFRSGVPSQPPPSMCSWSLSRR